MSPELIESEYRLPSGVIFREVGEEAILLKLREQQYYVLNSVGARVVSLLVAGDSLHRAVERITCEFDGPPEEVQRDIDELTQQLIGQGLLERV